MRLLMVWHQFWAAYWDRRVRRHAVDVTVAEVQRDHHRGLWSRLERASGRTEQRSKR